VSDINVEDPPTEEDEQVFKALPEPKKKVGRPKKKDLAANTPGKMAKRGRPLGEASAMADFKARILTSPKSKKVIEKIFDAALDDDHKFQSAAWKLIVDRIAPMSQFDVVGGGKPTVTINISGLADNVSISSQEDKTPLEGEYEEDSEDGNQE